MLTPIPAVEDPRWNGVVGPLQKFMAGGDRSWDDIFGWADRTGWADAGAGSSPNRRSRSYARQHLVRNAIAWLEHHGLTAWSRRLKCWRTAAPTKAAPAPPPTTASPTKRRLPALYHRTCHRCARSFFAKAPDAKLCPPCRPPACAICGDALPPEPVEDRFCCARHAARSRPSASRPRRHTCALPDCGNVFYSRLTGGSSGRRYCCSAHRKRAAYLRRAPHAAPRRCGVSSSLLQEARRGIDELGLTITETARLLGVHRVTLSRHLRQSSP